MANTIGMEAFVEIDENERYWVGKGFGKGGLLPTDRGAYTTTDGSIFWKSTEEASEDLLLLGRGWAFESGGDFQPTKPEQPEECWLYAADFRADHVADAKPNKGTLHFVRFRRLVRVKRFQPEEFVCKEIYEKCDHCDSETIDAVSRLFLDVIAYCSLLHNKSQSTDAIVLPLKKTIIDLAISHEVTTQENSKHQLQMLRNKLENFIEKERSKTAAGRIISGIHFSFPGRIGQKEFEDRCSSIAAECLTKMERDAIAGLIVRKLDPGFELHCDKVACGIECRFARLECPNEGCVEVMSRKYLEIHDAQCPHKIVQCDCGEKFKAREEPAHRTDACKLRLVTCPFKNIGCIKEVKACELPLHVTEDMTSHLLLAVDQIKQQQQVIQNLHTSLGSLRSENEELARSLQAHSEHASTETQQLQTKITKLTKELADFQKSCKNELKRLNTPKSSLT